MDVGVQILDAIFFDSVHESSFALATGIIRAGSSRPVGAIAVNVHVVIVARLSLEEDGVGDVAAVDGAAAESRGQLLGASAGLR